MSNFKKKYCLVSFVFAIIAVVVTLVAFAPQKAYAASVNTPGITDGSNQSSENGTSGTTSSGNNGLSVNINNGEGNLSGTVRIFLVLTVIALAPSILIMLTSFTRIIIVLHFVRAAIGTQTVPPNQVLVGLALFLTLFIMSPVFTQINENALKPLDAGEITQEQAFEAGMEPIREFMFKQTQAKDINTFCDIAGVTYETQDDISNTVLIPSFILSELRQAFIIGFIIYIPFIVIDMVVASVLMSMGMMMLPPTTISLPFKILLFVLADGWNLVIRELVETFY
ncbi:flagellar type III secretion system pore protein FliP [Thermoguttaceae bacterium LCP21S3_D4]|nr:flagellar type III secretion system pore protein FliP [Lachnospiraceae bacterium]MDD6304056.1 flagellar type III secretion system pore protein FliP [Lachnospiraceae bacterium]